MRLKSFVLASALAMAAAPAAAAPFTALYVFGDSLSDVGNATLLSGGTIPPPPYAPGRASNGPVAVDYLAQSLGLAPLSPALAPGGGTNYAVIGAATSLVPSAVGLADNTAALYGLSGPATGVLTGQLPLYGLQNPGAADANALYFLWAGGNDILLGSTLGPAQAQAAAANAALNVASAVDLLYAKGARHFLVPNLPVFNPAALTFNDTLAQQMGLRQNLAGIGLTTVDVSTRLTQFAVDPTYGFTRGFTPCLSGNPVSPGTNVCSADDELASILWDSSHPTTRVHELLAADFLEALPDHDVPEPATMLLGAIGLAGVAYRRRRAA
ncbi:hypothetical protein TBR22_A23040 [Luteitalea sp. TBR-22]|uniref:SGNH/GDSL hydrolase family protein n=1 Tax=Luteitalea sp. TBR-22 TaxID=2802971 RepID=UPI001AF23EDE|nr:SGNH/GDSL hydrolase family protein [Luteitalea sp. TBR-22]BCS33078.1 hypothetical protein TBR22_A23040 [Luteitalea sp. TBR-22]